MLMIITNNDIDSFKYYMTNKNYSNHTILSYIDSLKSYNKNKCKSLSEFKEYLVLKGLKNRSINQKIAAICSFCRWKGIEYDVQRMKCDKTLPKFITEEQMIETLNSITNEADKTTIMLLYCTGIRKSELKNLKETDFDFENRQIFITGKGDKQRIVPMMDALEQQLHKCMKFNDPTRTCRKYFNCGPHTLRHTFATHMINNGCNIKIISRILGHSSVSITELYAHINIKNLLSNYKHPHGQ